jgi:uncharacterized protein YjiS (DUF1127 family)
MSSLKRALRFWAIHREFRRVLAELDSYSDRELADLDLVRDDIAGVALEEAERRIATPEPDRTAASPWPGPLSAICR